MPLASFTSRPAGFRTWKLGNIISATGAPKICAYALSASGRYWEHATLVINH